MGHEARLVIYGSAITRLPYNASLQPTGDQQTLELPTPWLIDTASVVAVGKQRDGSASTPIRIGDGWDTYELYAIGPGAPAL